MTDAVNNPVKITALTLANLHPAESAVVVSRAAAYYAFLTGGAAASVTATAGGPNTGKATGGTAGGAATSKAPAAGAKAGTAGAAGAKAPAAGAKAPAAGAKAPAAGAKAPAASAAVPGDTKAPGGKHTYADVVAALRKVKDKTTKEAALAILKTDGGGAESVRDLKPAQYDAVVEACDNELEGEGTGAGAPAGEFDDGTTTPEVDELGLSVT